MQALAHQVLSGLATIWAWTVMGLIPSPLRTS